jgi:hypothetical protein
MTDSDRPIAALGPGVNSRPTAPPLCRTGPLALARSAAGVCRFPSPGRSPGPRAPGPPVRSPRGSRAPLPPGTHTDFCLCAEWDRCGPGGRSSASLGAGTAGGTDGPRRRPRRSRGPGAVEPQRRRVWRLRERARRQRRRSRAPSLTNSDAREGVGGEGVCFGTAELRDLSDTLHKQRVSGARLPAPGFRRPAAGARLPGPGFRRPASGDRLPAPGFRRPASGARLPALSSAPGFWRPDSGARLPLHGFLRTASPRCTASGARFPRLALKGFRRTASGFPCTAPGARLPAHRFRLRSHGFWRTPGR